MSFSNYCKLGRLLSLILIMTLLCTLFAGCKKEEDPSASTPNTIPGLNLVPETNPPTESTAAPVVTTPTEPNENMGTVTQQTNIRGTPSTNATVLGTLYAGDKVEVQRQDTVVGHVWGYIKEPVEGWISMEYVEMDFPSNNVSSNETPASSNGGNNNTTSSGNETSTSGTKGVITGNGINIRNEASINGKIQGSYNKGDVVTILETSNGWGRTDKGWVKLDYVNMNGSTGSDTNNNSSSTNNNNNSTNNNTSSTSSSITGNGSTTVVAKGVVKVNELNLRTTSSTNGDRLGSLKYGDRVEILEKDGSWGRTSKGWIHMDYIYQDGTRGSKQDTGTVSTDGLRIRSGPGTGYDVVGSYNSGDYVEILEQFTYGNTTWGCTSKGWISLSYVDLDNDDSDSDNDTSSTTSRRAIVTSGLYVRSGAGTNYEVVSTYEEGDVITILETRNGWGRTSKGWVSLNYVDFYDDDDDDDSSYDNDSVGTGTVIAEGGLRVRAGAGNDYKVVSGLEYGDRVTILETKNGWGRIEAGWISMDYVDMD